LHFFLSFKTYLYILPKSPGCGQAHDFFQFYLGSFFNSEGFEMLTGLSFLERYKSNTTWLCLKRRFLGLSPLYLSYYWLKTHSEMPHQQLSGIINLLFGDEDPKKNRTVNSDILNIYRPLDL